MLQYILITIIICGIILVLYNILSSKILLKGLTPAKLMYPVCISILMLCVFINYNLTEFKPVSVVTFILALILICLMTFSKEGISENGIFFNGVLIKWNDVNKISISEKDSKTILSYSTRYQKHKVMYFENIKRKDLDKLIPRKKIYS